MEVANYWVIVLYLMGSVILDSVKLHPPSAVFNVGFCLFCVKMRICDQHCKYFLATPFDIYIYASLKECLLWVTHMLKELHD